MFDLVFHSIKHWIESNVFIPFFLSQFFWPIAKTLIGVALVTKYTKSTKKSLISPPLSNYNSIPIANQTDNKENTSSFFNFFSWSSKEEILIEKRTAVCEELLDINKIVVVDQNKKLIDLSIEKDNMTQKITALENKISTINTLYNTLNKILFVKILHCVGQVF